MISMPESNSVKHSKPTKFKKKKIFFFPPMNIYFEKLPWGGTLVV